MLLACKASFLDNLATTGHLSATSQESRAGCFQGSGKVLKQVPVNPCCRRKAQPLPCAVGGVRLWKAEKKPRNLFNGARCWPCDSV